MYKVVDCNIRHRDNYMLYSTIISNGKIEKSHMARLKNVVKNCLFPFLVRGFRYYKKKL